MKKSPVVVKCQEMDFPDALREVMAGNRITRLEWDDPDVYVLLRGGFLSIYQKKEISRLLVSDGDLLAIDWVVVGETVIN